MCFTVAIVRNNTLLTTEKYYDSLPDVWEKKYDLPEFPDYYFVSGFTHPQLPVIKEDGICLYEWGLIPSRVKDFKSAEEIRSKTLNAVGETIFQKPSFRKCIESRRCVLPVTGFFEYRDINGVKYPYFIQSTDNECLLLGSIYDSWINESTGEIRNTFSIVTTPANILMEKIHNLKKRMPLILSFENSYQWIDKSIDIQVIKNLIKPYNETKMKAYTISRVANNVRLNRNVPKILNEVLYSEIDSMYRTTLF